MAEHIFGIDVHPQYQPGFNFKAAHNSGYRFAFVKFSQGSGYVPAGLNAYYAQAKASGMTVGGYHFLEAGSSGKTQADNFLRRVDALGGPDGMLLAVDFEHYAGGDPSNKQLMDFVAEVKRRTDHPVVLYTAKSFWDGGDSSGSFSQYGADALWAAHYADMLKKHKPQDYFRSLNGWGWDTVGGRRADIHQFTAAGLVAGQFIDVNASTLTTKQLTALTRRAVRAPGQEEPVPEKPVEKPKWQRNWEEARAYGRELEKRGVLYWNWDGGSLDRTVNGRPGCKDGPPPAVATIKRAFCADLLSLMQRKVGIPVPKNHIWPGGTRSYWLKYRNIAKPFRLSEVRDGDVCFRDFQTGGANDEGHIMVSDGGKALQSFASTAAGEPGVNSDWSVSASHDNGYYKFRFPREQFWA